MGMLYIYMRHVVNKENQPRKFFIIPFFFFFFFFSSLSLENSIPHNLFLLLDLPIEYNTVHQKQILWIILNQLLINPTPVPSFFFAQVISLLTVMTNFIIVIFV